MSMQTETVTCQSDTIETPCEIHLVADAQHYA